MLDLSFLQREEPAQKKSPDPRVRKLRTWRKKLIAHRDYEISISDAKRFLKENPVAFDEIQALTNEAFSILQRWATYHHSDSALRRLATRKDDYRFVLEAMRLKVKRLAP